MAFKAVRFDMDGGLVSDRLATAVPSNIWTGAQNMVWRDGVAERAKGYAAIGGNASVCSPRHLVAVNSGEGGILPTGASQLHYAGTPYTGAILKVGRCVTSTSTHTDVTPAAWVAGPVIAGQWTGGVLNGYPYLNHPGYAPIQGALAVTAATPYLTLADWVAHFGAGVGCIALRHWREFFFAMGNTSAAGRDGDLVYWSGRAAAGALPTTWTPAAGNAAGDTYLSGGGDVVDGLALGDTFIIYKRRSIYAVRYVGGNYIFDFQRVLGGPGLLSQNCMVDVAGQHVFLTEDDVMVWNGSGTPTSLLDGKCKKLLAGVLADANYANCWLTYLPRYKEIWVNFPVGSTYAYPTRALVIDLSRGQVGQREFTVQPLAHAAFLREATATLTGLQGDTVLAYHDASASPNGRFFQVETADTINGSALQSYVYRELLDFDAPGTLKKIRWVRPRIRANVAVAVTVGVAGLMTPDGIASYTTQTYTVGTSDKVNFTVEGRYVSLYFLTASGGPWSIAGFEIGYDLGGLE